MPRVAMSPGDRLRANVRNAERRAAGAYTHWVNVRSHSRAHDQKAWAAFIKACEKDILITEEYEAERDRENAADNFGTALSMEGLFL